jgi:hypothetical protein
MDTKSLEKFLKQFGKTVMERAKEDLYDAKGDTALGKSIRFEVVPTDKGFSTRFYMLDYGTYLDKGVSGNEEKRSYINTKGQTVSSPYSYTTKQPPTSILEVWIKKKGLEGTKGNKSFAFAIAKTIKKKGIKSLSFFQAPLGEEYEKLKEGLLTELKEDIETYITTFYRN